MYSAGILPYMKSGNEIFYLLGKDKRQKWSDFGGKCELKDCNNYKSTAAREFFEETCGSICTMYRALNVLNTQPVKCVVGRSYTNKNYYMFLVNIVHLCDDPSTVFETFRNAYFLIKASHCDMKYTEKNRLMWMNRNHIKLNENILRQVFMNTLNLNYDLLMTNDIYI